MLNKTLTYIKYIGVVIFALAAGVALAQATPVTLDPRTWFQSQDAVFAAVALVVPWITKSVTALGKDWFNTDGRATQRLSLGVAAIIGGVGGYLSLGYLTDVSGFSGALQAAALTAFAFLMSNGMAKSERQVAQSTVNRMKEMEIAVLEKQHEIAMAEKK